MRLILSFSPGRPLCASFSPKVGIPGWCIASLGGYTRVVYSLPGTPWYMPPYYPFVGTPWYMPPCIPGWCTMVYTGWCTRFYTFSHGVVGTRCFSSRKAPFSSQE